MQVVKASGEFEKFSPFKIKRTCLKAGCSEDMANRIVNEVQKKAYDGISTRDILKITLSLLKRDRPEVAARYDLKGSIFRLGPAGFVFEELIGEIFKEYGYDTKVHSILRGACVSHEVDIIATKDNENYMVECKYHNIPGIYTGVREALYTYARFLDLKDGSKAGSVRDFKQPWLICNTKFSDDAIKYSCCKGMRLIGWNYPQNQGLQYLIESKKLYPITMLMGLDTDSLERLVSANFILARDLLRIPFKELLNATGISQKKLRLLIDDAKLICG